LEGDLNISSGGWVDLLTGDVYDDSATDPITVGEDAVIDVEHDPDRWLWFDRTGSRDGWQDMAAFTGRPGNVILPYGSGWSGRSRARAHSAGSAIWTVTSLDHVARRTEPWLYVIAHTAQTPKPPRPTMASTKQPKPRTAYASALTGGWTAKQLNDAGLRPPKTPRTRTPRPEHTPARGENTHPPAVPAAPAAG